MCCACALCLPLVFGKPLCLRVVFPPFRRRKVKTLRRRLDKAERIADRAGMVAEQKKAKFERKRAKVAELTRQLWVAVNVF